jgi:cell division septum initiation protein DivIVA
VAEQTAAAQREAEEARRTARAEAVRIVGAARIEADEVRTRGQQMLDDARAEVAALTTRRDEIAGELGRLSGVIDALSVPGAPARDARDPADADVAR